MDILDDMGVSKLSAKVLLKVNYSFKNGYRLFFLVLFHLFFSTNGHMYCKGRKGKKKNLYYLPKKNLYYLPKCICGTAEIRIFPLTYILVRMEDIYGLMLYL